MKIERKGRSIAVKPYESAWFVCIFAVGMACAGVYLLIDQWPSPEGFRWMDAVGIVFLLVWIGFVLWMCWKGYDFATSTLVLCDEGVSLSGRRCTKELRWEHIQDYGLHYVGKHRGRNLYELYFAERPQPRKNGQTRKLDRKVLRVQVSGTREYDQVVSQLLPYCRNKTGTEPFVAGRFCI